MAALNDTGPLRIDSASVFTLDGRNVVSGWIRSRSADLPESNHGDVVLLDADAKEIRLQTTLVRLYHHRHSSSSPDRFTVLLDPWPDDAVAILIRPEVGRGQAVGPGG